CEADSTVDYRIVPRQRRRVGDLAVKYGVGGETVADRFQFVRVDAPQFKHAAALSVGRQRHARFRRLRRPNDRARERQDQKTDPNRWRRDDSPRVVPWAVDPRTMAAV